MAKEAAKLPVRTTATRCPSVVLTDADWQLVVDLIREDVVLNFAKGHPTRTTYDRIASSIRQQAGVK